MAGLTRGRLGPPRSEAALADDRLSLRETAARSGLSASHLRLLARSKRLKAEKLGRDWFNNRGRRARVSSRRALTEEGPVQAQAGSTCAGVERVARANGSTKDDHTPQHVGVGRAGGPGPVEVRITGLQIAVADEQAPGHVLDGVVVRGRENCRSNPENEVRKVMPNSPQGSCAIQHIPDGLAQPHPYFSDGIGRLVPQDRVEFEHINYLAKPLEPDPHLH